jgi:hypothetical protein
MKKVELLVLSIALLALPLTAVASTKTEKKITLNELVSVASTQLKPGTYKMEWNGDGPNIEVSFIQNNKVVATTPAQIVKETTAYEGGAVTTHKTSSGSIRLDEVDFKNAALKFGGSHTSQGGS